jgi:mycofactocin precursor
MALSANKVAQSLPAPAEPAHQEALMLEPTAAATVSTTTDADVEDLIEDVSIDGMCGVY